MDFDYVALLGAHDKEITVQKFMASLGLSGEKIKLKRGDFEVAFESEQHGIDVNFADPLGVTLVTNVPDGALVVSAIFFYAEGVQGHKRFGGTLPHGLDFKLSRSDIKTRFGAVAWSSPVLPIDRWVFSDHELTIWFSPSTALISHVIVHLKKS